MDSKNANRITTVINSLNSVTTKDADIARWIIDIIKQLEEIANTKMPDLNAASLDAAVSMVAGTCRSMGVTVTD